jgi:lipopolysaccharide transport system permease protein
MRWDHAQKAMCSHFQIGISRGSPLKNDAVNFAMFWERRSLIKQFIRRDIEARYRGSILGVLWSLVLPLVMLSLFTFIFSTVFPSRWGGGVQGDKLEFAQIMFAGMIVFTLFSDVVSRAPTLIMSNTHLVTKVAFPVEILPVVSVGVALFHAAIGMVALLCVQLLAGGTPKLTLLLLPVVVVPFALMVLGLSYFFAAIGVFLRDTAQVVQPMVMAFMFASPLFYPMSSLPEPFRTYMSFSPLVWPMEELRALTYFGQIPSLTGWAIYSGLALLTAGLGLYVFQRMRAGFADVL